ncbi:MAG TPA: hypothetical protein VIH42_05520 [Thermoguttaceae bacterium]
MYAPEIFPLEPDCWDVEPRRDGAVLVRVHSTDRNGRRLPDAVFTFQLGDPQYSFWQEKLLNRNAEKEKSS